MNYLRMGWEEFDILDAICERTFHKGAWKAFGTHGLSPQEILFLAKLRGMVTADELNRLREINQEKAASKGGRVSV